MVMKKENSLYARDEEGKLIPKEVELVIDEDVPQQLELKGETIVCIPMTRGEIKKLFADIRKAGDDERDRDAEVILKCCVTPEYTKEEVEALKPAYSAAIANTILAESGLNIGEKSRNKAVDEKEDEFSKN